MLWPLTVINLGLVDKLRLVFKLLLTFERAHHLQNLSLVGLMALLSSALSQNKLLFESYRFSSNYHLFFLSWKTIKDLRATSDLFCDLNVFLGLSFVDPFGLFGTINS